jgi:predicted RNA-binding Zn-ribbon protein involved in translation (DUF1610 family)
MSYTFNCHKCNLRMDIADDLYGIEFNCPQCGQSYIVEPETSSSQTVVSPSPSTPEPPAVKPPQAQSKIHIKRPEDRKWK